MARVLLRQLRYFNARAIEEFKVPANQRHPHGSR